MGLTNIVWFSINEFKFNYILFWGDVMCSFDNLLEVVLASPHVAHDRCSTLFVLLTSTSTSAITTSALQEQQNNNATKH